MASLIPADLLRELQWKLSDKATVLLRNDPDFREASRRWTEYQSPHFAAHIIVGDERDITIILQCAKAFGVPFLVSTGRHGDHADLTKISNGIQIDLQRLNKIDIVDDGKHAVLGGGVLVKDVTRKLYSAGKVTGVCETVGMGFWLGGGHGILQGKHGLGIDQIVEAKVILADGTTVIVSDTSEPDLFWGLRGAGHNFGIVTELKIKIYDAKPCETWTVENHFFSGDQLEAVFEALSSVQARQESTDQYFAVFRKIPEIDPDKATIMIIAYSAGDPNTTHLHTYLEPLYAIPSITSTKDTTTYPDHPKIFAAHEDGPVCQKGAVFRRYPTDLPSHNVPAVRKAYDIFNAAIHSTPSLAANSQVIFESYPVHAVQAVAPETTAFPWRADTLLVCPFLSYAPDPEVDDEACRVGRAIQEVLREGSGREELHAYVNYANGEEPVESLYGYEPWRLERLRRLKARYDPEGLFRYYGGIS